MGNAVFLDLGKNVIVNEVLMSKVSGSQRCRSQEGQSRNQSSHIPVQYRRAAFHLNSSSLSTTECYTLFPSTCVHGMDRLRPHSEHCVSAAFNLRIQYHFKEVGRSCFLPGILHRL